MILDKFTSSKIQAPSSYDDEQDADGNDRQGIDTNRSQKIDLVQSNIDHQQSKIENIPRINKFEYIRQQTHAFDNYQTSLTPFKLGPKIDIHVGDKNDRKVKNDFLTKNDTILRCLMQKTIEQQQVAEMNKSSQAEQISETEQQYPNENSRAQNQTFDEKQKQSIIQPNKNKDHQEEEKQNNKNESDSTFQQINSSLDQKIQAKNKIYQDDDVNDLKTVIEDQLGQQSLYSSNYLQQSPRQLLKFQLGKKQRSTRYKNQQSTDSILKLLQGESNNNTIHQNQLKNQLIHKKAEGDSNIDDLLLDDIQLSDESDDNDKKIVQGLKINNKKSIKKNQNPLRFSIIAKVEALEERQRQQKLKKLQEAAGQNQNLSNDERSSSSLVKIPVNQLQRIDPIQQLLMQGAGGDQDQQTKGFDDIMTAYPNQCASKQHTINQDQIILIQKEKSQLKNLYLDDDDEDEILNLLNCSSSSNTTPKQTQIPPISINEQNFEQDKTSHRRDNTSFNYGSEINIAQSQKEQEDVISKPRILQSENDEIEIKINKRSTTKFNNSHKKIDFCLNDKKRMNEIDFLMLSEDDDVKDDKINDNSNDDQQQPVHDNSVEENTSNQQLKKKNYFKGFINPLMAKIETVGNDGKQNKFHNSKGMMKLSRNSLSSIKKSSSAVSNFKLKPQSKSNQKLIKTSTSFSKQIRQIFQGQHKNGQSAYTDRL